MSNTFSWVDRLTSKDLKMLAAVVQAELADRHKVVTEALQDADEVAPLCDEEGTQ